MILVPIEKPPHLRSKTPLQQIKITEVPCSSSSTENDQIVPQTDLEKTKPSTSKPLIEVIEVKNNSKTETDTEKENESVVVKDISKSKGLAGKVEKEIINDTSILQSQSEKKKLKKPSSSVQFATSWSKLTNQQEKESYLCLLNSSDYLKVFKHSMEPSIFSGILEVLTNMDKGVSPHLLGISRVPRVSALILFLEEKELCTIRNLVGKVEKESMLSSSELKEIKKCFC